MRTASAALVLALMIPGLSPALTGQVAPPAPIQVDVLVYGGTSAGVIAAYTARVYGRSVLLVEPGRHLGGMSSGGLGQTDIGNKYAVSGLGLDFYRRVGSVYGRFEAWQFEPKVAEQVFESYVDEAEVEVLFSRRLKALTKEGTHIRTVTLEYAGEGRGAHHHHGRMGATAAERYVRFVGAARRGRRCRLGPLHPGDPDARAIHSLPLLAGGGGAGEQRAGRYPPRRRNRPAGARPQTRD